MRRGTATQTLTETHSSCYGHVPNAAAVVLGPTGLAFDTAIDTLYVA